jgi:MFS family permease
VNSDGSSASNADSSTGRPVAIFGALNAVNRRILIGNAISSLGSGLTFSFLVIYLGQARGLGTTTAGLIVAYIAVLGLLLTPAVGTLVDRIGPRPILMCGLVVAALGSTLLVLVDGLAMAILAATVLSTGQSLLWPPQAALLARVTPANRRQDLFGLQFLVLNLGLGLGGLISATIVDVAEPQSFVLLYLLDAMAFLAYLGILLPMSGVGVGPGTAEKNNVPPEGQSAPRGYGHVLRDRAMVQLSIAAVVMLTCGYGALEVGLPTYLTLVGGLPASMVAVAYAVNTAVIVAAQVFVLRRIRGRSRSRLGAIVGLTWAASWLLIGVSVAFPVWLCITLVCLGIALFGLGETIWSPIVPAIVNELAPEDLRGRYNAVSGWVWSVSGTVGPALAAVLLGADLSVLWLGLVIGGCLVAAFFMARLHHILSAQQDGLEAR